MGGMQDADSRALKRTGFRTVVRRTTHQVIRHRVVDAAASLTFFATLTAFPTALTVVSAVSILDRSGDTITDIIQILGAIIRPETARHLETPLRQLTALDSPELALAIGLLLTLWSLSGYATAFGRAMNTAYEVEEGRRIWKFRSMMLLVTMLIMVGGAVAITILLGTPTAVATVVHRMGWPAWLEGLWDVGKWPVLLATLVVMVGVLYYATPNVRAPHLRWVSAGAGFAIGTWALATLGFVVYVKTIGSINHAYGWLGGAILLLVYLYISNFVLVVGGELDSEIIRMRQLFAGVEADATIRLPLRDVRRNFALARWHDHDVATARQVRLAAAELPEPDPETEREEQRLRDLANQVRVRDERPLPTD
ncbi:YihY/virulence factor BrkB family protein [Curtobacterium sp. MCBD17_019]|nr:YihY/virulence factor BrkB family protein [Curtobacterium sp. MCBD17_019]